MAGPYNGHIPEFPLIRVDHFSSPPPLGRGNPWLLPRWNDNGSCTLQRAPIARLYLLTHVHTDHLVGLDNNFTGQIVCSEDTKRMLSRLEAETDRLHHIDGSRELPRRKYDGLRRREKVDYITALPYGQPTTFDLGFYEGKNVQVTITLLDANHCPGSTMFLITSPEAAVLHTGDVRADTGFFANLRRQPIVHDFCVLSEPVPPRRQLGRICIDTSALYGGNMPDKEMPLKALCAQMSLYPADTIFFLNVWCLGWEDVIRAVAAQFEAPIHVDRYKRSIYAALSDPDLVKITTEDSTASRFHACERFRRCNSCKRKKGRRVVEVAMTEVPGWDIEEQTFLQTLAAAACGEAEWPNTITVPIARHSAASELSRLVNMFSPKVLTPNTLVPENRGSEFLQLHHLFDRRGAAEESARTIRECHLWFEAHESMPSIKYPKTLTTFEMALSTDCTILLDEKVSSRAQERIPETESESTAQSSSTLTPRLNSNCLPLHASTIKAVPQVLVKARNDSERAGEADSDTQQKSNLPTVSRRLPLVDRANQEFEGSLLSAAHHQSQLETPQLAPKKTGGERSLKRKRGRRAQRQSEYRLDITHLRSVMKLDPDTK